MHYPIDLWFLPETASLSGEFHLCNISHLAFNTDWFSSLFLSWFHFLNLVSSPTATGLRSWKIWSSLFTQSASALSLLPSHAGRMHHDWIICRNLLREQVIHCRCYKYAHSVSVFITQPAVSRKKSRTLPSSVRNPVPPIAVLTKVIQCQFKPRLQTDKYDRPSYHDFTLLVRETFHRKNPILHIVGLRTINIWFSRQVKSKLKHSGSAPISSNCSWGIISGTKQQILRMSF